MEIADVSYLVGCCDLVISINVPRFVKLPKLNSVCIKPNSSSRREAPPSIPALRLFQGHFTACLDGIKASYCVLILPLCYAGWGFSTRSIPRSNAYNVPRISDREAGGLRPEASFKMWG